MIEGVSLSRIKNNYSCVIYENSQSILDSGKVEENYESIDGVEVDNFVQNSSQIITKKSTINRVQYLVDYKNGKNSKQYSCSKCQHTKEGLLFYSITNDNDYSFCKHLHYNLLNNNNDENANFIKIQDDPRITKVGKFIRNTSIDELPQLINVIKGDMSLVGNRPIPIYEAEKLTKDELCKRFLSPAGLTGLWQVEHRGKKGKMSDRERIELDNKYSDYLSKTNILYGLM